MIFVKVSYSKGFHAAGLLFLTLQLLMYLFEYVEDSVSILVVAIENWEAIAGCVLLTVLFVRKNRVSTDLILTIIAVLLWLAQFIQTFQEFSQDYVSAFLLCASGILGLILVIIGLSFDIRLETRNNKDD